MRTDTHKNWRNFNLFRLCLSLSTNEIIILARAHSSKSHTIRNKGRIGGGGGWNGGRIIKTRNKVFIFPFHSLSRSYPSRRQDNVQVGNNAWHHVERHKFDNDRSHTFSLIKPREFQRVCFFRKSPSIFCCIKFISRDSSIWCHSIEKCERRV